MLVIFCARQAQQIGGETATHVKAELVNLAHKFATEPAKPDDEPKHERATILLEAARHLALGQDDRIRARSKLRRHRQRLPPRVARLRGSSSAHHHLSLLPPSPAGSRRIAAHPRPRPRATDERTIDWNSLKHDISVVAPVVAPVKKSCAAPCLLVPHLHRPQSLFHRCFPAHDAALCQVVPHPAKSCRKHPFLYGVQEAAGSNPAGPRTSDAVSVMNTVGWLYSFMAG